MTEPRGAVGRKEEANGGPGGTPGVALALLASVAGSVGFIVAYQTDAGTQWLGLALTVALGGIGVGLVRWSKRLMPRGPHVQERHSPASPPEEERRTGREFAAGGRSIRRRGLLGGLLAGALGAFGLGALWPARSLGPRPAEGLRETGWADGVAVVDAEGNRVLADDLDEGGILTVFPEGRRSPAADDQVVLIRMNLEDLRLPAGREDWTPDGYCAFSKICTHAGCPVGLYQNVSHVLLCPCHQATFDVIRGCVPVFGPAARALPQLPLRVAADGTLEAAGEFSGPVGPDRWRLGADATDGSGSATDGSGGGGAT